MEQFYTISLSLFYQDILIYCFLTNIFVTNYLSNFLPTTMHRRSLILAGKHCKKYMPVVLSYQKVSYIHLRNHRYVYTTNKQDNPCLEEQRQKKDISFQQYKQLLENIKLDLVDNYQNYYILHEHFMKIYNPKYQTKQLLFDILQHISKYPVQPCNGFPAKKMRQHLEYLQTNLLENIHQLSNYQLNVVLLYYLKFDHNLTESIIYMQFVRFYVREWQQYVIVKYGLDTSEHTTIGKTLKHILKKFLLRSFMNRKPQYERVIIPSHPQHLIKNSFHYQLENTIFDASKKKKKNKSPYYLIPINSRFKSHLVLQFFFKIKEAYQLKTNNNLYHQFCKQILKELLVVNQALASEFMGLQGQYLRQLYIKLYIISQQPPIIGHIYLYDYTLKYVQQNKKTKIETSQKSDKQAPENIRLIPIPQTQNKGVIQMFLEKSKNKLQNLTTEELKMLPFKQLLLYQWHFNTRPEQVIPILLQKLSPLFLAQYCQEVIRIFQYCGHFNLEIKLYQTIVSSQIYGIIEQSGHLTGISLPQFNSLLNRALIIDKQIGMKLGQCIINNILLMQDIEMNGENLLHLFEIFVNLSNYKHQKQITLSDLMNHRIQTLRIFLFRYLSDKHKNISKQILGDIIDLLDPKNPQNWWLFDDNENNYPTSVFHELREYVLKNIDKLCREYDQNSGQQLVLQQRKQKIMIWISKIQRQENKQKNTKNNF